MTVPTYAVGTCSVNNAGTVITGVGTTWSGVNVREFDFISINGLAAVPITEVTDPTHLKIPPWTGANQAGVTYVIYKNYNGRVVGVAAAEDVATMIALLGTAAQLAGDQTFTGKLAFSNTTEATGVGTTAAALFSGGVEIAKKLFVGSMLTAAGGLTAAAITLSGNITAAGWTTSGVQFKGMAATFTDNSTAAGTVAAAYSSVGGGNTIATAVNAVTFTDYFEEYFKAPIAGAHVTLTNAWAVGADNLKVGTSNPFTVSSVGLVTINGGLTIASMTMSGNITAAGWTTSGVQFKGVPATLTDNSTAAGTVTAAYSSVGGGNTIATAVNAVTFTDYFEEYFRAPVAGAHVTLTNGWAVGADNLKVGTSNPFTVSTAGAVGVGSTLTVTGIITASAKGHTLGGASGTAYSGALTAADANILLYNAGSGNFAALGSDNNGVLWFRAGLSGTASAAMAILTDRSVVFASTAASTTTTTGALKVAGGIGVVGAMNIGGAVSISDTTDSSSSSAGALIVAGGLGVAGRMFVGNGTAGSGSLNLNGSTSANQGAAVSIRRGGTSQFGFGNSSGILGGTADDFVITAIGRADGVASMDITLGTSGPAAGGVVSFMNGLATPAGGSTSARILFGGGNLGIYWGSGAPTVSASQGSIYIRTDGAQNARLYLNNNSSTGWSTFNTLT
jgi:nitrogen fixation protein